MERENKTMTIIKWDNGMDTKRGKSEVNKKLSKMVWDTKAGKSKVNKKWSKKLDR